jgi:hypothetical protein
MTWRRTCLVAAILAAAVHVPTGGSAAAATSADPVSGWFGTVDVHAVEDSSYDSGGTYTEARHVEWRALQRVAFEAGTMGTSADGLADWSYTLTQTYSDTSDGNNPCGGTYSADASGADEPSYGLSLQIGDEQEVRVAPGAVGPTVTINVETSCAYNPGPSESEVSLTPQGGGLTTLAVTPQPDGSYTAEGTRTIDQSLDDPSAPWHNVYTVDANLSCLSDCFAEFCDGVTYDDVLGPSLAYGEHLLSPFPNDGAVCRAFWLPRANQRFVPQGLALAGNTAWVSGYEAVQDSPCQLVRVDLTTGATLAVMKRVLFGSHTCGHGGGVARTSHGLWIADTHRLWLLDPSRIGQTNPVIRTWSLKEPVRGSFLVDTVSGQLGLGVFDEDGPNKVHWFKYADMLRSTRVRQLIPQSADSPTAEQARAVSRSPDPRLSQGGAHRSVSAGSPRLWFTSSKAGCGMLVSGASRRGFAPGAEEIQFDNSGGLWAISESGSMKYQAKDRPHVPMLMKFRAGTVLSGEPENCGW